MSFLSAAVARRKSRTALMASAVAVAVGASVASCSPPSNAHTIAKNIMFTYGWGNDAQYNCLNALWQRESGWNVYAENAASGAYGIPQSLPGDKMASAGADWQTDAATQIRWGLGYIKSVYGTPCGAWANEEADGFY